MHGPFCLEGDILLSENPTKLPKATLTPGASGAEWLECIFCHTRYPVGPMFYGCPACVAQGRLSAVEMRYEPGVIALPDSCAHNLWAWNGLLPSTTAEARTSLGEGATSLLPLRNMGFDSSIQVFLKNETTNPTWSWKDRGNAVSVSMAKHFGFESVVSISTGNHGNAMAAMAGAAGLRSIVFCKADTPVLQLALMQEYGARVVIGGDAEAMVLDLLRRGGYFPCTVLSPRAGYSNPFGVEGFKTIAFEILQQLGRIPERVFVPVGSGDGIYGIWKGFRELRSCGLVDTVPRMYGCQTSGANSLVRAFLRGDRTITPLQSAQTIASSLAELAVGEAALDAVYDSGGGAIEVSDDEALAERRTLARRGIALEPSSCVPLACLRKVRESEAGRSTAGEVWVSIGSGAAPKWPDDVMRDFRMPPVFPDNYVALQD
jgi:threonine synthase